MCKAQNEGGVRCYKHDVGRLIRNAQAKKQYYLRQGRVAEAEAAEHNANLLKRQQTRLAGANLHEHEMELSQNSRTILDLLTASGYHPYVVGGSVRDSILKKESKDVDIEVYGAEPDALVKVLKRVGKVDEVGKSFGVIKVVIGDEDFDVSLPRRDSKTGDGHRDFEVEVTPDLSMYEATARRDFTVNALMYDHNLQKIVDFHGGVEDMEAGELKHVSDAFDEDPLRVLRGVQMASRFNMTLHPETVEKARSLKDQFSELSVERVQTEFQKLFAKGQTPHKAVQLLKDTGWDENLPGLASADTKALQRDLQRAQNLINNDAHAASQKEVLLASVFARHIRDDSTAHKFLHYTVISDRSINKAYALSRLEAPAKHGKARVKAWARELPNNISIRDWAAYQRALGNSAAADRMEQKATRWGVIDHAEADIMKGEDVMNFYPDRKPGRWMRETMDLLRDAQYSDAFSTREEGVNWLRRHDALQST